MRRLFRDALLCTFITALWALPASAQNLKEPVSPVADNVAIKGYDTVAYFTIGQPTKGKPEFAFSWDDTQWHFANARHRDLFAAKPERYAPQFKGFCAAALTKGKVKATNPEAWAIIGGKLYLSSSKEFMRKFQQNQAENVKRAETAWAKSQK
jgi:YHS domain-containing protein